MLFVPIPDMMKAMIEHIYGFDMIYHETTYLDNMRDKAAERFHCTTKSCGHCPQSHGQQIIDWSFQFKIQYAGSFSKRSTRSFPNTHLAIEGVTYEIH